MMSKSKQIKLVLAFLLICGFLIVRSAGRLPAQQEMTIHSGDFSQIGGLSSVSSLTLGSSSPPPSPLARQDYVDIYRLANGLLGEAVEFRRTKLQLIPEGQITVITDVLQNYEDYNDGERFYAFCADFDMLEETGDCPGDDSYHDKLKKAQGLFAILRLEPNGIEIPKINYDGTPQKDPQGNPLRARATDIGREGLLEATRELVSIHMIFGTEFQVDALDYRFGGDVFTADLILTQELCQLGTEKGAPGYTCIDDGAFDFDYDGGAMRQFLLALNVLSDTYNAEIGWPHKVYLADDFTNREIELFSIASGRLIQVMNEIALRYRQVGDDEGALAVYKQGARQQYMQSLALAQKAAETDTDFLGNGGWELLTNLGRMRAMTQIIYDGYNAFGYTDDYVPLQSYAELDSKVRSVFLPTATTAEAAARDAQRTFDQQHAQVRGVLAQLRDNYDASLLEMCGASTDDYLTCNGGLMEQNFYAMKAASDRIGLALEQLNNIPKRIKIEQDRAGKVISLTLRNGEQMAALSYAIGIQNAYRTTEAMVEATTDEWHAGVENRTTVTVSAGFDIPPFSATVSNSTSTFFGLSHSQTKTSSVTATFDPSALEIGYINGLRDVQQAATEVGVIGANTQATIRTILLEQATAMLELDIAIAQYNQLAAEHNHLVEKYRNLLDLRAMAQEDLFSSYLNNPAFRIIREVETINASETFTIAAHFAYLTAKALEYRHLQPIPLMGDIYRARTTSEITNFLDYLATLELAASPPQRRSYTISIAEDVLGLSDENLNPDGTLSPTQVAQLRYEAFQEYLSQHRAGDVIEFHFSTSIVDNSLFSPDVWNLRIADNDSVGNPDGVTGTQGIGLNILTRQLGDAGVPEIILVHGGHASHRTISNEIVEYSPGNAVLSGFTTPPGFQGNNGRVALKASVNGNNRGQTSPGLYNRSVAASNWTVRINLASAENRDFDVTKVEDIIILMDATAMDFPDLARQALAEEDAARRLEEFERARTASALEQ